MDLQVFENELNEDREYVFDIHTAASIGCDELVFKILKSDLRYLNLKNKNGWTPLMFAACFSHLKLVGLLLKEGASIGLKNKSNQNALIIAAKGGNVEVVRMLIHADAQCDDRDGKGYSAVSHAAKLGHRSVLQLLIEKGASIDIVSENGMTPLMLASSAGHEMIVKDLLQLGANVNVQSIKGETAKTLAARKGHLKVKSLLDSHQTNIRKGSGMYNLQMLLQDLRLSKYYHLFERQEIDIDVFWMLNENDLKEIGIQIVGPRKAMCNAIAEQHQKLASAGGNDPRALRTLNNRLLLENKRLQQAKEELESNIYREMEMKKAAEQNLNEGIKSLKNFSDVVLHTISYSVALQEKLKQTLSSLKSIGLSQTALRIVEYMEKLMDDIHHQSQLSLQQMTFKS